VIECGEVEPLRRDKHARYEVAASARNPERRVVATGASIGVLRRHAVEVSRKDQRCGRVGEGRSRAPVSGRPPPSSGVQLATKAARPRATSSLTDTVYSSPSSSLW